MASPSTVISLGYGSWGSVNLVPTLGYGSGAAPVVIDGPFCVCAAGAYIAGAMAHGDYQAGARAGQGRVLAGAVAAQGDCC